MDVTLLVAIVVPSGTLILTWMSTIVKISAYITKLDALLGNHDHRIDKLERSKRKAEKRLREAKDNNHQGGVSR